MYNCKWGLFSVGLRTLWYAYRQELQTRVCEALKGSVFDVVFHCLRLMIVWAMAEVGADSCVFIITYRGFRWLRPAGLFFQLFGGKAQSHVTCVSPAVLRSVRAPEWPLPTAEHHHNKKFCLISLFLLHSWIDLHSSHHMASKDQS